MDTKPHSMCAAQALVDHQHMQGGQAPAGNVVHVQVMLSQYLHSLQALVSLTPAARYNTGLLIKVMPKGDVFSFCVLSLSAPAVPVCVCWMMGSSDQCVFGCR